MIHKFLRCAVLTLGLLASTNAHAVSARQVHSQSTETRRIAVRQVGEGPDMILIHGLGGSADVWRDSVEQMRRSRRIHLVQIAGYGGSPSGANSQGPVLGPVVEELAAYLRSSVRRPIKIVGHSMGGAIALQLAARHPDLVESVMVIDMVPYLGSVAVPNAPPATVTAVASGVRRQWLAFSEQERLARHEASLATMMLSTHQRREILSGLRRSDPSAFAQGLFDLMTLDQRPDLEKIRVPVTVLYAAGQNVVGFSPRGADAIYAQGYERLVSKRLVPIHDSLHMIMQDQPQQFARELRRFARGR